LLSIGVTELVVIAAVLLLVVGPERMPKLMRTAGRAYGQLRRAADDLRRAFVLEADRQDAETRMDKLRERRAAAATARAKALEDAGPGTVAQDAPSVPDEPAAPDPPDDETTDHQAADVVDVPQDDASTTEAL
jgi:sec-independent protein translocase protein TatB